MGPGSLSYNCYISPFACSANIETSGQFVPGECSRPNRRRKALTAFFLPLKIAAFDESAGEHYGDIRTYEERTESVIGSMDLLIAVYSLHILSTAEGVEKR